MSQNSSSQNQKTVIRAKLKHSRSDVDIRMLKNTSAKSINVRKNTVKTTDQVSGTIPKPNIQKEYNLVLMGQASVGKSAILVRFSTGRFIHEYHPTLEIIYEMMADIDDDTVLLRIFDTANTTEPVHLADGQGFLIVYSVDNRLSFETAKQLVKLTQDFKQLRKTAPSIVLVGNKLDLEHLRVVTKREGRIFAITNDCSFFETSAMDDVNILTAFHETVRQIRVTNKRFSVKKMNSLTKFFLR